MFLWHETAMKLLQREQAGVTRRIQISTRPRLLVFASLFALASTPASFAGPQPPPLTAKESDQLLASTKEAIACLTVQERGSEQETFAGTGFFIHQGGLLLTNYHVIFGADNIFAHGTDGVSKASLHKVIYCDRMRDFCILQFAAEIPYPISVRSESLPQAGETVYALGFVGGCDNLLVSSGHYQGRRQLFKRDFLTATTTTVVGNSGGLLVDRDGRAFGVIAGFLPDREPQETYAIPILDTLDVDLGQEVPLTALTERLPMLEFQRGMDLFSQKQYGDATLSLTNALAAGPDYDIYLHRGTAFYHLGRLSEALADMNEALKLAASDRERSAILTNRGLVYKEQEELDRALEDLDQAIQLYPQNAAALHDRGLVHDLRGDHGKAIQDYSQAVTIDPQLALAYYDRGLTHHTQGNLDQAIADYTRALEIDPNLGSAYSNRAAAYYQQGDVIKSRLDAMKAKGLHAFIDEALLKKLGL